MFEFDWQVRGAWAAEQSVAPAAPSRLARADVAATMWLHWQEHCHECAPPQCYASCLLYAARADRKCARLVYGFARNENFPGLFNHGADVRFRRWGKIETKLRPRAAGVGARRFAAATDCAVTGVVNFVSKLLAPVSPFRRVNGAWSVVREKLLNRVGATSAMDFDAFVLEAFLDGAQPARVLLELWNGGALAFREAIALTPGANFVTLPAAKFLANVDWPHARLTLYPENDAELRLIFSWLDFVKFRAGKNPLAAPAAKVKVVAWDLDNTLWNGTLVESDAAKLALRAGVAEAVRALDERGILQTVVSKNDFAAAWLVVERLGLAEYFLFPAINWGAKSANLRQVAAQFNLGVDAFALVDDSAFERGEVAAALPQVRVFAETEVATLLVRAEFDVPVTDMSRARRAAYRTEAQRGVAQQEFSGDYAAFLKSCGMKLRLFTPRTDAEILRCHELVQRSNQLNLSSRRFTAEEFSALLQTDGVLNVAWDCADKFGSYGIVGFASVDGRAGEPRVTNLVLSCRVAQKRVEHAFFGWLARWAVARGATKLLADLIVTERNGPLVAVFDELKFQRVTEAGVNVRLELPLAAAPVEENIVTLTVEVTA
ncbi:MAG: hypothetical protein RLZZ350_464 [Verrucomicrobiota bacterium]